MEISTESGLARLSARESDHALSEQPEASTARDADEALLTIIKEMSTTLQRLELPLTTRSQASGIHATLNSRIVDEGTREQEGGLSMVLMSLVHLLDG